MASIPAIVGPAVQAREEDDCVRWLVKGALWVVWFFAGLLGLIGVGQRVFLGHLLAGYGSYVPWGLWVGLYFYGAGMEAGAFTLEAGGYVLALAGFRSRRVLRTTIVLSAALLLPAFLGLALDVGQPLRTHFLFLSPLFTSMMAFNAWMYGLFLFVAAGCFALSFADRWQWLKPLLCLGILLTVVVPTQTGAFFAVVDAKPFWQNPFVPTLFLTSALASGAALLLCVRWIMGREDQETRDALRGLRKITIGAVILYFVLLAAQIALSHWNHNLYAAELGWIMWGPYWWVFWVFHIGLGGVLALYLLTRPDRTGWVIGAFLVAVTFFAARLNVLIPGQLMGELDGLQEAFHHPRLTHMYQASLNEYLVGLFLLAAAMTIFYVGQKINQYLSALTMQTSEE